MGRKRRMCRGNEKFIWFFRKHNGKSPLDRSRCKWTDNINIILTWILHKWDEKVWFGFSWHLKYFCYFFISDLHLGVVKCRTVLNFPGT